MLIIGLGHRARQGKNTAAVVMLNEGSIGSRGRIYAYADALRAEVTQEVNGNLGLEELIKRGWFIGGRPNVRTNFKQDLPEWVKAETGKPRTLLQWWGTDYRRAQDPDYWVKRLMDTLRRENPDVAFVTDVRFPNEVDAIHAAGGYVVQVIKTTPPDIKVPSHPSEDVLDGYTGWDYTIRAANMKELRKQATTIYHKIVRKHGVGSVSV